MNETFRQRIFDSVYDEFSEYICSSFVEKFTEVDCHVQNGSVEDGCGPMRDFHVELEVSKHWIKLNCFLLIH